VEEQKPIENSAKKDNETAAASPADKPVVKKLKLLAGALVAVLLVVGLYFVNRYWISPAVRAQTKSGGAHLVAPGFSLTDITGKPLNLNDFKGKVVLLDFWATWCGPCRIEIPGFVQLQKKYADQGFTVVGISMDDSADPVVGYYKEMQMNYPVAVGNERLGELYGGVLGLPTTFVIGRDGRIYAKHVGATELEVFENEIKQLLTQSPTDEAINFQQAGRIYTDDKIELGNPAEIDSEIPGIDISKLTADQKEAFKKILLSQHCTCPCKMSLLRCRQVDRGCAVSKKLAQEQLEAFLKPKN
jgi:thiol-disulfide isomerase/thioredoxin